MRSGAKGITVSGVDDLDTPKGGEGVQGKVIPPSESGSQSSRESDSSIMGSSGATMAACLEKKTIR